MTSPYANALDNISQTILAAPDTNSKYYLYNIDVRSDGPKSLYIYDMVLRNNNNTLNFGVVTAQGIAYGSDGSRIGNISYVDYTNRNARYGSDVHLDIANLLDQDGTNTVSDIAHIIIQVNGYDKSRGQRISMAFITFVPVPGMYNPPGTTIPCLVKGSLILTPSGYKPVETIANGDLIKTADGRKVPVKVFTREIVTTKLTAPYLIPANTFAPSFPKADIRLSPLHAIAVKSLWHIPCIAATLYPAIQQYDLGVPVTYYHLECPDFFRDNLVCDGSVVESFANKQFAGTSRQIYSWNESKMAFTRCKSALEAQRQRGAKAMQS